MRLLSKEFIQDECLFMRDILRQKMAFSSDSRSCRLNSFPTHFCNKEKRFGNKRELNRDNDRHNNVKLFYSTTHERYFKKHPLQNTF